MWEIKPGRKRNTLVEGEEIYRQFRWSDQEDLIKKVTFEGKKKQKEMKEWALRTWGRAKQGTVALKGIANKVDLIPKRIWENKRIIKGKGQEESNEHQIINEQEQEK